MGRKPTYLQQNMKYFFKKLCFQNFNYASHKSGRRRGVAILISNAVNFELMSEVKDKAGRYVIVRGKLDKNKVTLFNVYAPPGSYKSYIEKLYDLIATESYGTLICSGDQNVQLQPKLDTTNPLQKRNPYATIIQQMLKELGMVGIWR